MNQGSREPAQVTTPLRDGFCGMLALSGLPRAEDALAAGLNTSRNIKLLSGKQYSAACTGDITTADDGETLALVVGNPTWSDPGLQAAAAAKGHAHALLQAYALHEENAAKVLDGLFSFAIIDLARPAVLVSVDRMARYPCYFAKGADYIAFASSARSLLTMLPQPPDVAPQGIYNYMYFHMVPAPGTVYRGVDKLQAGYSAKLEPTGTRLHRYWLPQFSEIAPFSRDDAYRELRRLLKEAVARCIPNQGKTGAFLSGGLDSSTVTGMLAELSGGPCDAYSIGFSADGYDEMAYARITAEHFGVRLHEYYVTPEDVVEALPTIAAAYDEPFGNSSALPAYFCARLAKEDGVDLLLAGDGGDELFAGNERYAKQKAFDPYTKLPGFLKDKLLTPMIMSTPAWLPLSSKAKSYVAQANTPLPDRLQAYNFLHRQAAGEIFTREYLDHLDTHYPQSIQRGIYHAPEKASELNRMLFLDWQFTLADNDLRKVSEACSLAGLSVAYPMLDDALINFSELIPSNWKLPGRDLRDFYKKAFTGWLPEETINKSKHGFGLPFGLWMHEHTALKELAYENIQALKIRGIFEPKFLDQAILFHRSGDAAYYGELVWILCALELWLSSHLTADAHSQGEM